MPQSNTVYLNANASNLHRSAGLRLMIAEAMNLRRFADLPAEEYLRHSTLAVEQLREIELAVDLQYVPELDISVFDESMLIDLSNRILGLKLPGLEEVLVAPEVTAIEVIEAYRKQLIDHSVDFIDELRATTNDEGVDPEKNKEESEKPEEVKPLDPNICMLARHQYWLAMRMLQDALAGLVEPEWREAMIQTAEGEIAAAEALMNQFC